MTSLSIWLAFDFNLVWRTDGGYVSSFVCGDKIFLLQQFEDKGIKQNVTIYSTKQYTKFAAKHIV